MAIRPTMAMAAEQQASPLVRLMAAHPLLFRGQAPICWSEVPQGWWAIVNEVCIGIESVLAPEDLARFQVLQIKQKLGGLRFYWRLQPDERAGLDEAAVSGERGFSAPVELGNAAAVDAICRLVSVAYDASLSTCEICGGRAVSHSQTPFQSGLRRSMMRASRILLCRGTRVSSTSVSSSSMLVCRPMTMSNHCARSLTTRNIFSSCVPAR